MFHCALKPNRQKNPSFRLLDLGHPLEKILHYWGLTQLKRLPLSYPEEITYAPLERMTLLTGTLNGILVVRSTLEFAALLRNQRADNSLGRYNETEVFEELVALYSLYLFHDFWAPEHFQIGPIQPFRSVPADWPLGDPHAICRYRVGNEPVEIRLWMKD